MRFQRDFTEKLCTSQQMKQQRRDDLLRVAAAMKIPRAQLSNPDRFQEVARVSSYYDPARQLIEMMRDVARTVRLKGTPDQQSAVRREMTLYFQHTLLAQALEPLGQEDFSGSIVGTIQASEREQSDAICAVTEALPSPSRISLERAAREFEEAAMADEKAAEVLRRRAALDFDSAMEWR